MGLAPILVEQIFDIIRALHKSGTTILLVEQNAQALSVANRAYVLETGKISMSGDAQELRTTMQSGRRIWGRNARQPGRWQKPLPGSSFASRLTLSCKYGIV